MKGVLNKDEKLTSEKVGNSGPWCFAVQEGSPHFVTFA